MLEIFIPFALGLGLFLFGVIRLSNTMKQSFTEQAKSIISKYTGNIYLSILIGVISTILLDSSSAVIILAIVFINSGSLTFKQAIGIILGCNIGTTFSSQLIAMNFAKYSFIPIIVGAIAMVFTKNSKYKSYGQIIFFFGILFLGLYLMEQSAIPLKDSILFENWITNIEENYVIGASIGALMTLLIQSSGATVGIAIIFGKQQAISTATGIAIMLGAELGTCSSTLMATYKGSRQALKAALFHLTFNLITISIGLFFFTSFYNLIESISGNANVGVKIANAHILFNIIGVLLFLPFIGISEKILNTLLPENKSNLSLSGV